MQTLIYTDAGTSTDSVNALFNYFHQENTHCVTGSDLQKNNWIKSTGLLIIPGGRSLPFYKKLGTAGNQNIKKFVEQGGCYLGLCAGAYYACQETIFAKGLPLELILPGELNFFKGRAIGPVFADKQFAYHSENGARTVEVICHDQQIYSVYFNGGCYFENAEQFKNSEILAGYVSNKKPAIIACAYGKGRAILSGVHPELSLQNTEPTGLWQNLQKWIVSS